MGRYSYRFVEGLTESDVQWLEEQWHRHPSDAVRCRAHAILVSNKRRTIAELALIFDVTVETIHHWLKRWEESGRNGLEDEPRSGRPPILSKDEQEDVGKIIKEHPQEPRKVLHEIDSQLGKSISRSTLRRVARKLGFCWKRMRRSLKKRRDSKRFALAMEEIQELREMQDVKLVYFDEAGFSISGVVGYAWQPVGDRIEIPISGGSRKSIQMLGFEDSHGHVKTYMHQGIVTGETVLSVISDFAKTIKSTTVLILDNASPHTCKLVQQHHKAWAERGLILYPLPPYSPELNQIEHLWHKLKYQLIPPKAWETIEQLSTALYAALRSIGRVKKLEPMPAV